MQVDLYFSTYRPYQNQEVCDHRGCSTNISMLAEKSVSVKTEVMAKKSEVIQMYVYPLEKLKQNKKERCLNDKQ